MPVQSAASSIVMPSFPAPKGCTAGAHPQTESLLRKAMEDYETKMFLAGAKNITLGDMLDMWVEEDLKPGSLSPQTSPIRSPV